jgi:hypothetical protein
MSGVNAIFSGRVAGCSPQDPEPTSFEWRTVGGAQRRRGSVTFRKRYLNKRPRRENTTSRGAPRWIGLITTSRYIREHDQIDHNIASSAREYP